MESFSTPSKANYLITSFHASLSLVGQNSCTHDDPKPISLNGSSLSFALATNASIFDTSPISSSISSTASLAPPWAGPHKAAMPEAIHANGLAPEEPANQTVEVDAFCSWSAWSMKILSMARDNTGSILLSVVWCTKHHV